MKPTVLSAHVSLVLLLSPNIVLVPCLSQPAVAAPPASSTGKTGAPAVGDKARDFELENLDGKKIKLSTLAQKHPVVVVVLRGYPGYQCPVCMRQVRRFTERAKDFRGSNAEVVLVYPGAADDLRKHAKEFAQGQDFPAEFHFVLDPDFQFTDAWRLRWRAPNETAYPSTFVVDKDLSIRFAKISRSHGGRAAVDDVLKSLP